MQTPHLDALAARGVRFQSAYSNCPICVPSRASLATGCYVHETRYWDNACPYDGRIPSWGHRLREAGHRVVAIGKLHYRSEQDDAGFSNTILPMHVVDGIGDVMGSIRDEPPIYKMEREDVAQAGPGDSIHLDYDAEVARRACDWLREQAGHPKGSRKPWVLFVSFVCPHPPFVAPPHLYEKYAGEDIPMPVQNRPDEQPMHPALRSLRRTFHQDEPFTEAEIRRVTATYYAMCTYTDQQVGRVLNTLEELGLANDTRVIYTSDHGESMGRRGLWGKFTMYEESVAVPLIVAGPGVPEARASKEIVSLVDCYPSIVTSVGLELTEEEERLPGQSLWPIADGASPGRSGFSEYHAVGSTSASYMVRLGGFKYICYVGQRSQLFGLESDPGELSNLAENPDYRAVASKCDARLRSILNPEGIDAQAKSDQQALIERHGGREKVLQKGTFGNTTVPGQEIKFRQDVE